MDDTRARGQGSECLVMFESEARYIVLESARRLGIETGGELFGLFTRGGRQLVHLATGPGSGAKHEPAHFTQDLDAIVERVERLGGQYGLQLIGAWHCHHRLGIPHPSAGDVHTVVGFARRNPHITSWVEVVTTAEEAQLSRGAVACLNTAEDGPSQSAIRLNAFTYSNPQDGQYARKTVRIIPGVSPFRRAVLADKTLDPAAIGDGTPFHTGRLLLDEPEEVVAAQGGLPEALAGQVARLPEGVRQSVQHCVEGDAVAITIPIMPTGHIRAVFGLEAGFPLRGAYLVSASCGQPTDVTTTFGAGHRRLSLPQAYELLAKEVAGEPTPDRTRRVERAHGGTEWRRL